MGYELSENMNAENVVKALKMAVKTEQHIFRLFITQTGGLQYCSEVYQKVLVKNKIKPSMTDGYDCYQNAFGRKNKRNIEAGIFNL